MLHGSELRSSPFKLNFIPPCEDELWYASTPEHWQTLLQDADSTRWTDKDHNFLNLLKHFWKHAPSYAITRTVGGATHPQEADTMFPVFSFSRTSRLILYGIIAVAWDLRRRGDTKLAPFRTEAGPRRVGGSTATDLSNHIHESFQDWISWWTSQTISLSLKHVALTWRNCVCLFRLAHTLYEIGSTDLRIAAGLQVIEGRVVKSSDYATSIQRVKKLLRNDSALYGVLGALKVIRDRLSIGFASPEHCHHCSWALYLAALVIWLYGHALKQRWHTSLHIGEAKGDSRSNIALLNAGFGAEACELYLDVAIADIEQSLGSKPSGAPKRLAASLGDPSVVLYTAIDLLGKGIKVRRTWLITGAISHLKQLAGDQAA
jgi:hypothetical protein